MSLLSVKNIGKAYRSYTSEWQRFARWFGFPAQPKEEHWVLRNINFDIQPGEAIGIIGQNGAGKSTLLKIITGTLQPSEGAIKVNGRVSAILELGMGFNPDLTGRQNAYHGLGLMGFSHAEIEHVMPELEAFAEVGDYFDQPVRTYSSGMQMRVAFAVVTAWRPEILIVDEALSVGDAAFQRKCFSRIEKFRESGTTLLFVSHDIEIVKRLCDQAMLLQNGIMEAIGSAKSICDIYEKKMFGRMDISDSQLPAVSRGFVDESLNASSPETGYGGSKAKISSVVLENQAFEIINVIHEGITFFVRYKVTFFVTATKVKFGIMIKTVDGVCIYGTNTKGWNLKEDFIENDKVIVSFELKCNLVPGTYYLNAGVTCDVNGSEQFLHRRVDCLIFRVKGTHFRLSMGNSNLFAIPEISRGVMTDATNKER